MAYETFHYSTLEDVKRTASEMNAFLPLSEDVSPLYKPLALGAKTAPNRIAFQPMEGTDGTETGAPGALTIRRYERFAKAGPGLIWFEAVATVPQGRASAHQLYLREDNLDEFKRLTDDIRETCLRENGYVPVLVMQATNSGRYSKPTGAPDPMIAYNCPPLEDTPLPASRILSDEQLRRFEEAFGVTARLSQRAGFDGMDVKCCHRYLACELLSAYTRPGEYGGSFENRTRLLRNGILAAKAYEDSSFMVTCRLGIYDGYAYPYGFGVSPESGLTPDLTEPIRLVRELHDTYGLDMVNLTMGNPYATTHVTRPFDKGKYQPDEHPFIGLDRMIHGIGTVKKAVPEMTVFASAPSYLRRYADLYSAGAIEQGLCDGMLFGRMAFADPDFANEIIRDGRINPKRVCMTCGSCGDLIRAHKPTGCVIRDPETFMPFFREFQEIKKTQPANFRG